ncbi:MAG: phosphotransferase [Pseudomonadota bacterium]
MTTAENQKAGHQFEPFLAAHGWAGAQLRPLAGDASTRSYQRAALGDRKAVLMHAPPAAESAPCPPDASPDQRETLGYNAMARLAGPNLAAFTTIAETLNAAGLSAPKVYAADLSLGLALIEDLGDDLFARIADKVDEAALYEAAIDALIHLHKERPAAPASPLYRMLDYDETALKAEMALLPEWYWPLKKGEAAPREALAGFAEAAEKIARAVTKPSVVVLRDYHAENLLWLPDRKGVARVGLIDFQDGLVGAPAYDLVSLLEDARRDVGADLAAAMIERYCAQAKAIDGFDEARFLSDYALLAAQRNAKILGVFARLAKRDGKARYLDLLPRVEAHFRKDLARDAAAPMRRWIEEHLPELAP